MKSMTMVFLLSWISLFFACGKKEAPVPDTAPTNLTVNATVNASNNGSVTFTASATNAVSYEYDLGNGVYKQVSTGTLTYQYEASGTYTVKVTAKSAGGKTASKTIPVTVTLTFSLVWSDEFNTNGVPDASKWGYDIGTGSNGWGNNELEYYTNRPENAIVDNGVLKIKAIKESYNGSAYTSARLVSRDKFAFKYGKVEVSAKLPTGVGTWPAVWMLGSNINTVDWPSCGEIDIMEHKGSEPNKIYGTFHYPGRSGGNADGNTRMITNASAEFHKYSLDWSASAIKIYVDDQLVHSLANSAAVPFNHDFFLILNLAIGGGFAGPVEPSLTDATLEIDYVRVYQ